MEKFLIYGSWFWTLAFAIPVALVLFLMVRFRAGLVRFNGEVHAELAKCTWPWDPEQTGLRKYKILIDSTVLVFVAAFLMGGYVTVFDLLIKQIISLLVSI